MKLSHILGIALIAAACIAGGWYLAWRNSPRPNGDGATQAGGANETTGEIGGSSGEPILAQGRLEPESGVVQLAALPGERVTKILVKVGDPVQAGDPVIKLESNELYRVEYNLAQQRLATAKAQIQVERKLALARARAAKLARRQTSLKEREIAEQGAELALGEQQAQQAERDLTRLNRLAGDQLTSRFISNQQVEQQSLLRSKAFLDWNQAKSALKLAKEGGELASRIAANQVQMADLAHQQIDASDPQESLALAVEAARLRVEKSDVRSPIAGEVLRILIREGERAANAPVMLLADTRTMICVAEVYDSMRQYVRVGDKVELRSPAINRVLSGKVEQIGRIIGDPDFPSPNPLAPKDRHTIPVKIRLDAASQADADDFIHLQVDVVIHPSVKRTP